MNRGDIACRTLHGGAHGGVELVEGLRELAGRHFEGAQGHAVQLARQLDQRGIPVLANTVDDVRRSFADHRVV